MKTLFRNRNPKSLKNITRFDYGSSSFSGWRVCISRRGETFRRYFSDREFGSQKKSLEAAKDRLEKLKEFLSNVSFPEAVMSKGVVKKANKVLDS